jgi:hypothetical protein
MTYKSDRGFVLAYQGQTWATPVLTVELYCKWYTPYLVMPGGTVQAADIEDLEDFVSCDESAWGGSTHVWNPDAIVRLCNARKWTLCDLSHELMIGRWMREHKDQFEHAKDPA